MKKYNSWDEIDKDTNGLVTSLTYIVLFVNDQVYNYAFELKDIIKATPYYRQAAKKHANDLYKHMVSYNTRIQCVAKVNLEALALITASMEDDIKPHIDKYKYAVSQALHNWDIHGDLNNLLALCSTIDMLCQTSKITIRDFYDSMLKKAPIAYNPLEWLSLDKALHLVRVLTDTLTPKEAVVNLNEVPAIATAFQAIANKMLSPEVFEKAFNEAETINLKS